MPGLAPSAKTKQDHAACSGCSLCLLVCPVWRRTRDLRLTPHGRAKALQHGATIADIAPSVEACTLCGACEPVCPENIGLVDMMLDLRRALPPTTIAKNLHTRMRVEPVRSIVGPAPTTTVLVAGATYLWRPRLLASIRKLLGSSSGITVENDNGADISLALEIGAWLPPQRLERFLAPLRLRKKIVVADGLLLRSLRTWLPDAQLVSLGVALSSLAPLRRLLRAGDLYVIEPRAYHADHANLVTYYDELRAETGCTLNLDLQRIAIPAATSSLAQRLGLEAPADDGQIHWIMKGRHVSRIVVENVSERAAFEYSCAIPIVHLAELAND
ncbi:MAG: 4Fe-4S dicluster domain-containing protein [Burkholderiales bacterium]